MKTATHTLLATTGASPQVITETLYAIHHSNAQWPDAVFLITTRFGKSKAVQGLLEEGHLQRLCQQLQRPLPAFDASHVLVAPGADGQPVEDARSVADHEALANFIMTEVRNRTVSDNTSLHASLAGGRKTMTFYIGYAMSLFGRVQDSLSHVLVSEGYENIPGFWFPTTDAPHRHITSRDTTLDASLAQVTLAPIPFVRHRHDLPQVMLQTTDAVNFAQLVQLINLGENPEALRLQLDLPTMRIRLRVAHSDLHLEFAPGLLEMAYYALVVRFTLQSNSDLFRPSVARADETVAGYLLKELMPLLGLPYNGEQSLAQNIKTIQSRRAMTLPLNSRTLEALENGMSHTWFDQRKNQLGSLFLEKLPASLVRWIQPSTIWTEDGQLLGPGSVDKVTKNGGYGIHLQPHQISIVDMPQH